MRRPVGLLVSCMAVLALGAPSALAQTAGGAEAPVPPPPTPAPVAPSGDAPAAGPTVPGATAKLKAGVAYAPADAPAPVQRAIWAGNDLQSSPYRYGGGHGDFVDTGYDCSGTVSYALHGGGLLDAPLDSSSFLQWGEAGPGQWITVYTNPGHAYVVIAGLRLDTSAANDPRGLKGPRWRKRARGGEGFTPRHVTGL
ncbi:MAG TPA: hypothetical protein VK279_00050 [Solirubrobacteraceae bacterium]|nr:hypothetical protein [Solirubrobacteraceae bacterium]